MKATLINQVRVWWHCLIRMHQPFDYTEGMELFGIYIPLKRVKCGCWNCDYGKDKNEKSSL